MTCESKDPIEELLQDELPKIRVARRIWRHRTIQSNPRLSLALFLESEPNLTDFPDEGFEIIEPEAEAESGALLVDEEVSATYLPELISHIVIEGYWSINRSFSILTNLEGGLYLVRHNWD